MAEATPDQATTSSFSYPRSGIAWTLVILLTLAYVLSFVDRMILSLLIQPIKADLGFSDTQIALLLGPAFGFVYSASSLIVGYFADRSRRTWILAGGIALWSVATALTGFAKSFGQMFVARMAVGAGESTMSPCAMSMITDSFPEDRRGKPIAVYSAAISLGFGIAALVGAAVLTWAESQGTIALPAVGEIAPWQFAFLAVGLPGLMLALIFVFFREPPRHPFEGGKPNTVGTVFVHVGKHWPTYLLFASLFCYMTICAYSHGWLAEMFRRTHGWATKDYALYNGIATLAMGPPAVIFAGWLSDRLTARGMEDAPMRIAILGLVISLPFAVAGPLISNAWGAFAALISTNIGFGFLSAVGVTALVKIVPPRIRAQTIAIYYLAISMSGTFLGPPLVGILNDNVFGEMGIAYSIALVPLIYGLPALILAPWTLKLYRRALADRLIDE